MMSDKILEFVKAKGPVLPSDITRPMGMDTLFAGAHLSQLVDSKKLKITHMKHGGSPYYYLPGQEQQLLNLLKDLNAKEKQVFDFLQQKKVVKDSELQPLQNAIIHTLKDFAIPINVTVAEKKELFWKFFLATEEEVREIISNHLSKGIEKKHERKESKKEEKQKETSTEEKQKEAKAEIKVEEKIEKEEDLRKYEKPAEKIKKETVKKEKKTLEDIDSSLLEKVKELIRQEMQQKAALAAAEIIPAPIIKKPEDETDEFFKTVFGKFKEKQMTVTEYEIIKENAEFECVVSVSSAIGSTEFFCRARNKKRFTDGDLSSALVKGQSKKLQTLFAGPGELTKKAQEMLDKDFKNQVFFFKV